MYQIPDKDLEKRRCEQRVDPLTDVIYTKSEYAPESPATDAKDKDDEEEEEEEEEEEAEEEMIEEEEQVSHDNSDRFQDSTCRNPWLPLHDFFFSSFCRAGIVLRNCSDNPPTFKK